MRSALPVRPDGADGLTSLTGDVAVFRAYDVCQLLGLAHATGTLVLRTAGVRGAIYFEEGRVVGARSRPHPCRLGTLLLEAQAVGRATLERAVADQMGGDRRVLGEILLASQAISPTQLALALAAQAKGALTALLILPAGRFAFAHGLLPPSDEHRFDGIDPQELVFAALARIDELNAGRPVG